MLITHCCLFQTDDFVDFFERCQSGLAPGGLICVKENITKTGVDLDSDDSSVTRYKHNLYDTVFSNHMFSLSACEPKWPIPLELFLGFVALHHLLNGTVKFRK